MDRDQADEPLRTAVVGGAAAGLAFAINLVEQSLRDVQLMGKIFVTVYDNRYMRLGNGEIIYGGARRAVGRAPRRREQVVTLQDNCVQYLSEDTQKMLFRDVNERSWPTSRNIPIMEVEDRLLERAQQPCFQPVLTLKPVPGDTPEQLENFLSEELRQFHIVIGADGSNSWVRSHFFPRTNLTSEGWDYALGVSFKIPQDMSEHGLPLPQHVNNFKTVSQRRFLLNASSVTRSGFLNIQVSKREHDLAVRENGMPCRFGQPGFTRGHNGEAPEGVPEEELFKPQQDFRRGADGPSPALYQTIRVGLACFEIPEECVTNVIGIMLNVRWSDQLVIVTDDGRMIVLCGDAAFQTHFWPGRGMNSVLKEAAVLAWSIFRAKQKLVNRDPELLRLGGIREGGSELQDYQDYVTRLRRVEHGQRSLRFTCNAGRPQNNDPLSNNDRMAQRLAECDGIDPNPALHNMERRIEDPRFALWGLQPDEKVQHHAFLRRLATGDFGRVGQNELVFMQKVGPWPQTTVNEVLPGDRCPKNASGKFVHEVILEGLLCEAPSKQSCAARQLAELCGRGANDPAIVALANGNIRAMLGLVQAPFAKQLILIPYLVAQTQRTPARSSGPVANFLELARSALCCQRRLQTSTNSTREDAAGALRDLAQEGDFNQVAIGKTQGALEALVALCQNGTDLGREMAAWALRNLALNDFNQVAIGQTPGAINALVALCQNGTDLGKTAAAWALANLALKDANEVLIRTHCSPLNVFDALEVQRWNHERATNWGSYGSQFDGMEVFEHLRWTVTTVTIGTTPGAFEALVALCQNGTDSGKEAAAWALRKLALNNTNKVAIGTTPGSIEALVALCQNGTESGKEAAAWALRYLAASGIKVAISTTPGAIQALVTLCQNGTDSGKEAAAGVLAHLAWTLNNVTIGTTPGAFEALLALSQNGTNSGKAAARDALSILRRNCTNEIALRELTARQAANLGA